MARLLWEACLVYIDDVIIMGNDFQSHLCNISAVLSRLRDGGLKVKPSKCHFFKNFSNFSVWPVITDVSYVILPVSADHFIG